MRIGLTGKLVYNQLMRSVLFTVLCLFMAPVLAAPACVPGHGLTLEQLAALDFDELREQPLDGSHVRGTLRLREVRYFRQNVFPDRDHWLARQANRFNMVTKERTLQVAFSVDRGASINETQRQEAERELRRKPYLSDAAVLVHQVCGDEVDLDVVVRDVWTFTPSIGVSRSGGDNETNIAISDVNILGTGKSISLEHFSDRDRSGNYLRYDDPNLFGTRWFSTLVAADNDDGNRYTARLTRPFFSLDIRLAGGFTMDHIESVEDLEFLGKDAFELDKQTNAADLFIATSNGRADGWVKRTYFGARYLEEIIEFPVNFPGPLVDERTFAYPYVGWELIEDRYATRTNVDRIGITEDLKLGWTSYIEVGWSPDALGGDGDHILARGSAAYRRYLGERQLIGVNASFSGRYDLDLDQAEDVQLRLELSYLWQQSPKWRFLTKLTHTQTQNLPLDKQVTLGGDSGLRGYPSRYQPGDRSALLTLEQRYYSNAYPFGLVRVGYAVFADVGRAWFDDDVPEWLPVREGDHFDTLANVGVGLRLESVRTRRDRVFHIDIAKPLVDGPFVDNWEITFSGKQAF